MNQPETASTQRFLCLVQDKVEGPFDLIELAGQFRCSIINSDTLICCEGAEDWIAFRERTEYASVQDIPIETIALHLERKAQVKTTPLTNKKPGSFPWLSLFVFGIICVAGLMIFLTPAPKANPQAQVSQINSSTAPAGPWIQTVGNHFSVVCPARLKQIVSTDPASVSSYRGFSFGIRSRLIEFGVDTTSVRGRYSPEDDAKVVNSLCNHFIYAQGGIITSDRTLNVDGANGREVLFKKRVGSMTMTTGVRAIAAGGTIIMAWVVTEPETFSRNDISRYLDSLEVY